MVGIIVWYDKYHGRAISVDGIHLFLMESNIKGLSNAYVGSR